MQISRMILINQNADTAHDYDSECLEAGDRDPHTSRSHARSARIDPIPSLGSSRCRS